MRRSFAVEMRRAGWRAALFIVTLLWSWATPALANPAITVVLSDGTTIYQEVAQALSTALQQDTRGWQVRIEPLAERNKAAGEDLVITLGLKALRSVLAEASATPVWSLLVPRQTFERIAAGQRRPLSALYLDQPLSRHIRMLQAALPEATRLGVLLGPSSAEQAQALRTTARSARLEVISERIERPDELIPAIDKFRGRVDVLLLLPDPVVLNRATLRMVLLHTYRLRLPVAAYSLQLIEAGAMLALYASPSQIGAEAGAQLRQARDGGGVKLPAPAYPDSFDLAVNRSVASSLGIRVPVGERIRARMAIEQAQ